MTFLGLQETFQIKEARPDRRLLVLLTSLFFGSGCAALIYEIVWYQLLEFVIGVLDNGPAGSGHQGRIGVTLSRASLRRPSPADPAEPYRLGAVDRTQHGRHVDARGRHQSFFAQRNSMQGPCLRTASDHLLKGTVWPRS